MTTFTRFESKPLSRAIVGIWGQHSTRKSSFGLSAPEPVVVMDMNLGLEYAANRFADREILVRSYQVQPTASASSCVALMTQINNDFFEGLKMVDGNGGTLVVDGASELYELVQVVKLDEVRRTKYRGKRDEEVDFFPYDWAEVHLEMRKFYKAAFTYPRANVLFIHEAKDSYDPRTKSISGDRLDGWKRVGSALQVVGHTFITEGGEYKMGIEKARINPTVVGKAITDPTWEKMMTALRHGVVVR